MTKNYKQILWFALVAVTSFWMWAGLQTWLRGSLFDVGIPLLSMLGGLFVILLSLLALGLMMLRDRLSGIYLGIIVSVTYSLLFRISSLNLVGMFVLIMLFYQAHDVIKGEIAERIKMNSRLLIKKGLSSFVLAFFILASFAAYQSPAIETFKNIDELPAGSQGFIRDVVDKTMGTRIEEQTATTQQKEVVVDQVAVETTREINLFLKPYFEYVPPALAFGLFIVLWGLGWIFIWLAVLFGMLVFFMLRKLNFIKIEEYDIKAERLVI